jgi:nucleoside-diphosphate-sugar epimerase
MFTVDGDSKILIDQAKAAQELGYKPSVPLEEGIARTIKWYRDNGLL